MSSSARRLSRSLALCWTLLSAVLGGVAAAQSAPAGSRPNIVLILADDLGYSDIASYGGEIRTPHLDRLAAGGVRFTQFYNAARCSPTRASLLTGLYPHQAGLGHMPDGYARRVRETFDSPSYLDHLSPSTPTVAEILRGAGYATFMTGKWHLGYQRPYWPVDRGFDRSFALLPGAMNYYGHGVQGPDGVGYPRMVADAESYQTPREGFFATDAFTDQATRFIRERDRSKPFFLYLAHVAPHWPLHAPTEDVARFRGSYLGGWDRVRAGRYQRLVEMGIIQRGWPLAPRPPRVPAWDSIPQTEKEQWDLEMAVYAAQIERMDAGIGKLLQTLRESGAADNTLIVFLSDNGGAAENPNRTLPGATVGERESFAGYDIRGAHVSSAPFRLTKKFMHEGGIATPLIAYWPAGIRDGGKLRHQPSHLIDLLPTFLELAGARMLTRAGGATVLPSEGVSLLPAFRGEPLPQRTLFWEHEGNRAVREGRWKLVSRYPGDWELYDLEADRTERDDLAKRDPQRVRRMVALYEEWAARVGAKPWALLEQKAAAP